MTNDETRITKETESPNANGLPLPLFGLAEAERAGREWGFNCGPAALAVMLGMTPQLIRPHLLSFEDKGYTNPTLMFQILNHLAIPHSHTAGGLWPDRGLVRIQWAGPWSQMGVPARVAYRHTHWVATTNLHTGRFVFDINAISLGGWIRLAEWSDDIVPVILRECEPKASGEWWMTHGIELQRNG